MSLPTTMRVMEIASLTGPGALTPARRPVPDDPAKVLIEVVSAGVSFPELLLSRGLYQYKPPPPFVPGSEVAGKVVRAPEGSPLEPGQRVAGFCFMGGFAEFAEAPPEMTFPLSEELDFDQGAALILNYQTAYFALHWRGRLASGETVLVQGAAGGLGSAAIQVARGLGAKVIAVVSDQAKADLVRGLGAEQVVLVSPAWKDEVLAASGGGVNVVFDPVGGDRFDDSVRCLRPEGRLLVLGFTGGSIPTLAVNRVLLRNIDVVGVGWGGFMPTRPDMPQIVQEGLDRLIRAGYVRPYVGTRLPLEAARQALELLESRRAMGKIVLRVRD